MLFLSTTFQNQSQSTDSININLGNSSYMINDMVRQIDSGRINVDEMVFILK